jgi:tRNA G18 (ribose-2'-O)-methylase SpoU
VEGPGLPGHLREKAVSIPISPEVESLNAVVATAIALYVWKQTCN